MQTGLLIDPRAWQTCIAWGSLLPCILCVFLHWRRQGARLGAVWQTKATHVIPMILQICMLSYWSLYSRGVRNQIPSIALMLVFGYALDLLMAWTRTPTATTGFGPFPIVLSTNLFAWFQGEQFYLSYVILLLAFGSRHYVRVGGRHIFNPSAFGLSVIGTLYFLFPETVKGGIAANLINGPPNMLEVMLLLSLVPQIRIGTAGASLGAFVAMNTHYNWFDPFLPALPANNPWHFGISPIWTPVFLVLVLLTPDPATIPRNTTGRLLFGWIVGFGIASTSLLTKLLFNGEDYFAKVIPIPLANLLTTRLDMWGEKVESKLPLLNRNSANWAIVVVWLYIVTQARSSSKSHFFESERQYRVEDSTPYVVFEPDGSLSAANNPVFAKPFSFAAEVAMWRRGRQ
jgi:hypothetical protein